MAEAGVGMIYEVICTFDQTKWLDGMDLPRDLLMHETLGVAHSPSDACPVCSPDDLRAAGDAL